MDKNEANILLPADGAIPEEEDDVIGLVEHDHGVFQAPVGVYKLTFGRQTHFYIVVSENDNKWAH